MTRRLALALLSTLALPVSAQTIYKCVDSAGGTLISNSRVDKNCKAIVTGAENAMPAPAQPAARAPRPVGAAANPTPAGFPKVEEGAQKARDNDRRHILEQEMAGEQRSLEQAKKDLAEQESQRGGSQDRLVPYRERVGQHERNIQAIQRELTNLK